MNGRRAYNTKNRALQGGCVLDLWIDNLKDMVNSFQEGVITNVPKVWLTSCPQIDGRKKYFWPVSVLTSGGKICVPVGRSSLDCFNPRAIIRLCGRQGSV